MISALDRRPAAQLAPPVSLDVAFDAPGAVLDLVHRGAPFKTISAVQKAPDGTRCAPWFRNFWALGGKVIFDGAQDVFHNPRFVEAAREAFGAAIVEPIALMTNLNAPAPGAPAHLDLPFFRGAHRREVPSWMLAPMGYSGLFQRWAIPVASAISWLSAGSDESFEYWPGGSDAPAKRAGGFNHAVVADNEYMYHRVGPLGPTAKHLPGNEIPFEAMLHRERAQWVIRCEDLAVAAYDSEEMRISVLWKAYCFKSEAERDAHASNADCLTPRQVVDIFQGDLRRRGVRVDPPASLDGTDRWADAVMETYVPTLAPD